MKASLWLVQRGDPAGQGDALLEIVAGSATVDLPAPVSGVLVAKLVVDDEPLEIGQRLGVVETVEE